VIPGHSRLVARLAAPLLLVAASIATGGCATMFTGTTDTLTFDANVPGVRLTIDGQYRGELPLALTMSRNFMGGQQFVARFERDGYAPQEFRLNREFNTVAILDVTSIPTSGGVDVLTGSLLKFSPTGYHVQMLEAGKSAASAEFRRSTTLWGYALVNHRNLQKDIARGGGPYLSSFASAVAAGDERAAALVREESLRSAGPLLAALAANEFVERFDAMLARHPALRAHRI
jgi:hypothetical protein